MTEKTFYAAGRYSRRLEIAQYATMLESYGWKCTASWLKGEHESNDGSGTERDHIEWARQDEADIRAAGVFIVFTGENRRGGMHTELGIARALGKRCVIIGERPENIFYGGLERWDMADFDLCAGNLTASPPCEAQQKSERPAKPKTCGKCGYPIPAEIGAELHCRMFAVGVDNNTPACPAGVAKEDEP